MEQSFIEFIVGQAGISGVAALSLWLLRQSYQDAFRREQENSEQHRVDKERLICALEKNSAAMAQLEMFLREARHG